MSLSPSTIKDNVLEAINEECEHLFDLIDKAFDAMYNCGFEAGTRRVIDRIDEIRKEQEKENVRYRSI